MIESGRRHLNKQRSLERYLNKSRCCFLSTQTIAGRLRMQMPERPIKPLGDRSKCAPTHRKSITKPERLGNEIFRAEAEILPRRWFRELEIAFVGLQDRATDEISSSAAVTQRRWPLMCKIAAVFCIAQPTAAAAEKARSETLRQCREANKEAAVAVGYGSLAVGDGFAPCRPVNMHINSSSAVMRRMLPRLFAIIRP